MQLDLDFQRPATPPPAEPVEPKVHTVTEITRTIRGLIEGRLGETWVEGEISNLRKQASGHHYFTLKDDACQLSCVMFAGDAAGLRGQRMADGQHVQAFGQLTVYEARGQYQMIVRLVKNQGEGALQAKFEALKRKLAAEGLFDAERKRPLPRFPRCIGLVTSPTGAALRDFLKVLHRRHPGINVLINPVRVQGAGAAREIAQAIRDFGEPESGLPKVDVIVVTRGGGSIEDLWEFNEEIVARAIAASPLPVLSAIGHEIDFTIADFVADLRAPTPSAAAEILAADRLEVIAWLQQHAHRMDRCTRSRLDLQEARLRALATSSALREPERRLADLRQTLDRRAEAVEWLAESALERRQNTLHHLVARLDGLSPSAALDKTRLHLRWLSQKLEEFPGRELTTRRNRLEHVQSVLSALSPSGTLARGYTITLDDQGQPLTKAAEVKPGQKLTTRFADGEVESVSAKR